LAPYEAAVDTCSSGKEAIELVKSRDYDIVFMDHLMPEMDGIETRAAIRTWEQKKNEELKKKNEQRINNNEQVPIIALTANAVVGMKEMLQTMPETDALPLFVTQVHALKSASASIGAAEVSAWAGKIEAAGKAGNLTFIGKNLSGFAETLAKLIKNINAALELETDVTNKTPTTESFIPLLRDLEAAL